MPRLPCVLLDNTSCLQVQKVTVKEADRLPAASFAGKGPVEEGPVEKHLPEKSLIEEGPAQGSPAEKGHDECPAGKGHPESSPADMELAEEGPADKATCT